VLGEQAITVAIPTTAFNAVQCSVYNEVCLGLELPTLNNGDIFPRVTVATQDTEVLQAQHLMYLPTKYAPLLLDNKGYYPKEALNMLICSKWTTF
jgi:hypothetical protein